MEIEIKIILFTIAEKYEILRNKSNKRHKNPKTLLREIKEFINKWRYTLFMSGRLNIVKMPVLPKLICKLNAISIKFPSAFFVEVDHLVLKFT